MFLFWSTKRCVNMQTGKRGGRIRVGNRKLNEKCWTYVNKLSIIALFDRAGYPRVFQPATRSSLTSPQTRAIISNSWSSKGHWLRMIDLYSCFRTTSLCSQIRVITYKLFLATAYNSLSVTLKVFRLALHYARRTKIILNKIVYEISFTGDLNFILKGATNLVPLRTAVTTFRCKFQFST